MVRCGTPNPAGIVATPLPPYLATVASARTVPGRSDGNHWPAITAEYQGANYKKILSSFVISPQKKKSHESGRQAVVVHHRRNCQLFHLEQVRSGTIQWPVFWLDERGPFFSNTYRNATQAPQAFLRKPKRRTFPVTRRSARPQTTADFLRNNFQRHATSCVALRAERYVALRTSCMSLENGF